MSTEKKLRPVGSTSGRPRVGAPLGPGSTNRPSSARSTDRISAGPLSASAGRRRWSICSSTARVALHAGCGRAAASDQVARQQLQALDRIATGAPGAVAQRTAMQAASGPSTAPPSGSRAGRSRPDRDRRRARAAAKHRRLRPTPRGTLTRATSRSVSWSPAGRLAEHVQAVPDLQFLQLAQMVVELAQGSVRDRRRGRCRCPGRGRAARSAPGSRRAGRPCAADRARPPRSTRRPAARARTSGP